MNEKGCNKEHGCLKYNNKSESANKIDSSMHFKLSAQQVTYIHDGFTHRTANYTRKHWLVQYTERWCSTLNLPQGISNLQSTRIACPVGFLVRRIRPPSITTSASRGHQDPGPPSCTPQIMFMYTFYSNVHFIYIHMHFVCR